MIDIITFDYTERLLKLKHNVLYEAGARGIMFELQYSPMVKSKKERRMILSNMISLCRTLRGKYMIISSASSTSLEHRSPGDIASLVDLLELNPKRMLDALTKNMASAIKRGKLRKMFKGVISEVRGNGAGEGQEAVVDGKNHIQKRNPGSKQGSGAKVGESFGEAYKKLKNG